MGTYARIESGSVAEIGEFDSIEGRFHPSLLWAECPAGTQIGDRFEPNAPREGRPQFSRPPVVPRVVTAADIAARRYRAEVAGTTCNGWPIHTDRESQAKITAAYALARDGHWPPGSGWKFVDGWRVLAADQIIAAALAVTAHVQACFAVEAQKVAALQAGQPVDLDAGWPGADV